MKRLALAVILSSLVLSGAVAADQTCKAQADAKKLAGAALTSFMKKCEVGFTGYVRQEGCRQEAFRRGQG